VDAGRVSERWLTEQVRKFRRPELLSNIRAISGDKALLESLERGSVGRIMADSARIQMLSRKVQSPSEYQISAKTYNRTS
jgi:hypothetical protein